MGFVRCYLGFWFLLIATAEALISLLIESPLFANIKENNGFYEN